MGAWGTAIFSDDAARDVRDSYLDLLGDGLSGPETTKKLLVEWAAALQDPAQAPVFWLALASTQSKYGRLEPFVLDRALRTIDDGSDLARWDIDSKDYKKRRVVLDRLRAQLTSPQPPARPVSKRFHDSNEWHVGDLIGYRLLSGRFAVLRVIGHHSDKGGTSPICELLDWTGDQLPDLSQFKNVGIRKTDQTRPMTQFMLGRTSAKQRPDSRLHRLGLGKPLQTPHQFTVLQWRQFDTVLKERFEIQ
jgi:hypothetical protein